MATVGAPSVEYSKRLMASQGGWCLALDAGIKNTKRVRAGGTRASTAIHTMINEDKVVIGQYACSNSPKELLAGLLAMRVRLNNLPPPASGRNHAQASWRVLDA